MVQTKAIFGIGGAVVASIAVLIAIPIVVGLTMATISAAWGLFITILFLVPAVTVTAFAFGSFNLLVGTLSYSLFLFFDRIASFLVFTNFGGAIISLISKSAKNEKVSGKSNVINVEAKNPSVAIFISLIPGLNWIPWIWTLADSKKTISIPAKLSLVKNIIIYGGTVLFAMLSSGRLLNLPGNAWLFAQIFGSIHFILLQRGYLDNYIRSDGVNVNNEDELRKLREKSVAEAKAKKASEQAAEALKLKKELAEFDVKLGTFGKSLGSENVMYWKVQDVVTWLEENELSHHAITFVQHDVDGNVLLNLNDIDLKEELGIISLGERKRILSLISQLRRFSNT